MWQVTISERIEAIGASISRLEDKYEADDEALEALSNKITGLYKECSELEKKKKELNKPSRITEINKDIICLRTSLGTESRVYENKVNSIKSKIASLELEKDRLTYRLLYLK